MAKKSIEGQMDLFELFASVEELEENVKGVPELKEVTEEPPKPEPEAGQKEADTAAVLRASGSPVMQRSFSCKEHLDSAMIAYLDYNMVYLKDWESAPVIYQFAGTKDAVDFYVEQMQHFLSDKKVKIQKEPEELKEASVRKWTGEIKS